MPLSDALLDFLEDTLPPAIYDTIFTLLDHLLTVFTSLNSGFAYFLRSAGCVPRHVSLSFFGPRTHLYSIVATRPTVRMDTARQFRPYYRQSYR